jgi:tRNA/tmRNA/rRNA uracil-C5-methylase (TrmA/RlmC/RlmD family)
MFSVSEQYTAEEISRILQTFVGSNATVTDATACIGGNTISFAEHFKHVIGVESDEKRFKYLQANLKILGHKNCQCIQGDYVKLMDELKQDAIFLDPPWGGPEYKDKAQLDLFLSEQPLEQVLYFTTL